MAENAAFPKQVLSKYISDLVLFNLISPIVEF